jgi:hypothetical protein
MMRPLWYSPQMELSSGRQKGAASYNSPFQICVSTMVMLILMTLNCILPPTSVVKIAESSAAILTTARSCYMHVPLTKLLYL